jgi:hypothetical protein
MLQGASKMIYLFENFCFQKTMAATTFNTVLNRMLSDRIVHNVNLLRTKLLAVRDDIRLMDNITTSTVLEIMKKHKVKKGSITKMEKGDEINLIANSIGTSIDSLRYNDTKLNLYAVAPMKQTFHEDAQIKFFNDYNLHGLTLTKMPNSGPNSRAFIKQYNEDGTISVNIGVPTFQPVYKRSSSFDAKTEQGDFVAIKYQNKSGGGSQNLQRKNLHEFIELAYLYLKNRPEEITRFYVLVDGPYLGTKYIQKYRDQINDLGMTDRIFALTNQEVY